MVRSLMVLFITLFMRITHAQSCVALDESNVCGKDYVGFPFSIENTTTTAHFNMIMGNLSSVEQYSIFGCLPNEINPVVRYQTSFWCSFYVATALEEKCPIAQPKSQAPPNLCVEECNLAIASMRDLLSKCSKKSSDNIKSSNDYLSFMEATCDKLPKNQDGKSCNKGVPIEAELCGWNSKETAMSMCKGQNDVCCNSLLKAGFKNGTSIKNGVSNDASKIAGIVMGTVLLILLIAAIVFWYRRKRNPKLTTEDNSVIILGDTLSRIKRHDSLHKREYLESTQIKEEVAHCKRFSKFLTDLQMDSYNQDTFSSQETLPIEEDSTIKSDMKSKEKEILVAIASYSAENSDELNLTVGDHIYCIKEFDDGWAMGCNPISEKLGMFPLICVRSKKHNSYMEFLNRKLSIISKKEDFSKYRNSVGGDSFYEDSIGRDSDLLNIDSLGDNPFRATIYLGIQSKLPGRSYHQDLARDKSSSKAQTSFFSKYLADPVDHKKKEIEDPLGANQNEKTGGIMDKFPFLSYILADQEIKDGKEQKSEPICKEPESDCQKLKVETSWTQKHEKKPIKTFPADPSGNEKVEESSFFRDISSKIHNSDLYSQIANLLADAKIEAKDKPNSPKSEKTKGSGYFFSFPSFESILADPDLANARSGQEKDGDETQQAKASQESSKIKESDKAIETEELRQEKSEKGTQQEENDLLEEFKILLQGHSATKDSIVSEKDIKVEFKKFLEAIKDADNKSIKTEQKISTQNAPIKNERASIFATLRSFLVPGEELAHDEAKSDSPEADNTDRSQVLEALRRLLAERKERKNSKPTADIADALQRFLVDGHQEETTQNFESEEKTTKPKPRAVAEQEESEVVELLKGLLADQNAEKPITPGTQDAAKDSQSFFSSLLVNSESQNYEKAADSAKIVSFFKKQINQEKSSNRKNEKGPVKEFLNAFARFLADENQADLLYEDVSSDDHFHLGIKSVLQNAETSKETFSDEIKRFSSYLKQFFHSEGHRRNKGKNPSSDLNQQDDSMIEKFLGSILA